MPQNVYFDESGFTGNNLLDPDQGIFAYASVAADEDDAKTFVNRVARQYKIKNSELKGNRLLRFNGGRKVVDETLQTFRGRLKVSVSDKKFALACKFYEYIFEPSVSASNQLFYEIGFHRFIASMLYLEFRGRGIGAEEIFAEFEELMRGRRENELDTIFSSSVRSESSPWLQLIRDFAQYRADDIRTDLAAMQGTGGEKWVLDLTSSSLYVLLAAWGTEFEEITAICDPSKPLQHGQDLFASMIGRSNRVYSDLFGSRHPVTFNLSGPIQFPDSKATPGLQIADVVAAAAVHVLSGKRDEQTARWAKAMAQVAHGSVLPDLSEVNTASIKAQINALVLIELTQRAKSGRNLTEGMGNYLEVVSRRLLTHPLTY